MQTALALSAPLPYGGATSGISSEVVRWCGLTGYVVIELKTGKFQIEHAGKLNVYVALIR